MEIRCGNVSSSHLHRPWVRRKNKLLRKIGMTNRVRRAKAREEREEAKARKQQQKQMDTVISGKQSRLSRFMGKVRAVLNKKVF